jgi:HlyD family secretion protein
MVNETPAATAAAPKLSQLTIDRGALAPVRRRRRRWLWWAAGAVALLAAAGVAFGPRKFEVQTASVVNAYPTQQYAQLTASGYVVAQRRAAVASKATGRLVELKVREGSVVKKDEVVARIDASDVQATILSAQAGVRQAEAGLRQSGAQLNQAQVEQANAEAELKRTLGLQAQGFVSPQAVDNAQTRASTSRAATKAAEAGLGQARASVSQAQAQLKVQQVNEDYTLIRAPFDGVVLVKNANVGDIISPFSSATSTQGAVVTMADMGTLEVEADVSESNVAKVKAEQPVEITLDALPDMRFRGSVARIVPTVDRAKATVMTKVRFEKLDPRILPEMSAKVSFLSRPATDADQKPVTAVNPKAVAERDGKKVVFRVKDDHVEAVPVTPGRTLGDALELTGSALKSGEKVVLSPDAKLHDGAKVSIAAAGK